MISVLAVIFDVDEIVVKNFMALSVSFWLGVFSTIVIEKIDSIFGYFYVLGCVFAFGLIAKQLYREVK